MTTMSGNITRDDYAFSPSVLDQYAEVWDSPSFGAYVAQHAQHKPETLALADDHQSVTWRQLHALVSDCTRSLTGFGIGKGDVVVVQGDNSIQMAVMLLSVMELGALLCSMQDRTTCTELEAVLRATGARYYFVADSELPEERAEEFRSLAEQIGTIDKAAFVSMPAPGEKGIGFAWNKGSGGSGSPSVAAHHVQQADPVRIMFTSGSTGAPKGVLHSLGSTISACRVSVDVHNWKTESVGWVVVPIALNWGQFQLLSGIISGAMNLLRRRHDGDALLRAIEGGEVTHVGLPPTGYISLIDKVDRSHRKQIGQLTTLVSTGAPCGLGLLQDIHEVFGVHVSEAYGITEGGWVATNEGEGSVRTFGADVGQPTPGTLVRITDQHSGAELPREQVGSVQLSGPSLFCGYYNNPIANSDSLTEEGWFRTGDLGYVSDDGNLILTGREKDVIKHGGNLVTPLEVEETIYKHGPHREVVVLGMPDAYYGEKIVAVFEATNEEAPTLVDITSYLDGKLAKFKWPQEVYTVAELPRTPTGKVKKNVLAEQLKLVVAPATQNQS